MASRAAVVSQRSHRLLVNPSFSSRWILFLSVSDFQLIQSAHRSVIAVYSCSSLHVQLCSSVPLHFTHSAAEIEFAETKIGGHADLIIPHKSVFPPLPVITDRRLCKPTLNLIKLTVSLTNAAGFVGSSDERNLAKQRQIPCGEPDMNAQA